MRIFFVVWIGQFISLLGSKLSEFALAIWAYQQMTSVTHIAFLLVLMYVPNIIASPFAGALIDRWNRRSAMLFSDFASGICSVVVMLLAFSGHLQLWHIYIMIPLLAIANSFQTPAYSAGIAQLVPQQYQGHANGLADLPIATSRIITPLLAGILIGIIQLKGILLIDCLTFFVAIATLLSVRFPNLPKYGQRKTTQKTQPLARLWHETIFSWRYIKSQPSLLRLWIFIILTYFTIGMFDLAFWLLVLKSGTVKFGVVLTAGGFGLLAGSAVMSLWGGSKRRIYGILGFTLLQGIMVVAMGFTSLQSLPLTSICIFIYLFADPIIMGSSKAIWQRKVPLNLQGRVFSLQLMLQRGAMIPAYICTGLLVDRVFEPLIKHHALKDSLGSFFGTAPGSGVCLFLIILGIFKILISCSAYRKPLLLKVDWSLPDVAELSNNTYPETDPLV